MTSQTETRPAPGTRLRGFSSGFILVIGVVLIPMGLGLAFNSWSAPDADAYVRMAFAQVAGATVAIVTVVGLVVQRIVRRSSVGDIAWFALIAVVITTWQVTGLSRTADFLLNGLGLGS
ncbi:hypothetical protein [Microbacterium sp. PMB16]|uniref:hypothetical protein n=1 Tax=Microbacterium sp. PMB16 TaxID=3120157 RepID=UPI003F4C55EF